MTKPSAPRAAAHRLPSRSRSGFSLLEIIIVISVMAILAGVAVPVASTMFNSKARRVTSAEMDNLGAAIVEYFRDTEELPSAARDLMIDPGSTGWSGPYVLLDNLQPVHGQPSGESDAWGNTYALSALGSSTIQLSSAGSDETHGTSDDLTLIVDVTVVRREVTLDELRTVNQAILLYNADHLPDTPLSTTFATLLSTLVATGYLPSSTRYETDGWSSVYVPDPPGLSPVVRVTSTNL